MDVFDRKKRSEVMSHIRGSNNRDTELAMIGIFKRVGISGWRRHQPLFGKPDFVFRRVRLVVFVDGCFWHSCPKHGKAPATHRFFWRTKLQENVWRDKLVTSTLRRLGWRVIRVWECEIKDQNQKIRLIRKLNL